MDSRLSSLRKVMGGVTAQIEWWGDKLDKNEFAYLDRKTKKLLRMYGALHPRSNVSLLYLPRREGGLGLIIVEDAIYIEERNINVHVSQSQERLLTGAWRRKNIDEVETSKECKDRKKRERIED